MHTEDGGRFTKRVLVETNSGTEGRAEKMSMEDRMSLDSRMSKLTEKKKCLGVLHDRCHCLRISERVKKNKAKAKWF